MNAVVTAIIYVPAAEFDTYALRCTESCKTRGYKFFGITQDWGAAVELKEAGVVDKIIVGHSGHIDPLNLPGVEVATADHVVDRPDRRSRRRRPRIV